MNHLDRIAFDSAVMGGKPCIRGMRVTVDMILGLERFRHAVGGGRGGHGGVKWSSKRTTGNEPQ